ncbi:MAG: T9SS type A sorting domain-containing protein [Candidatus Desantisbacteria bacterium]
MKNLVMRLFLSCLIIIITAISYAGKYLPILTWPGTGTYKSDGLDPEVGVEGTTFTFRVKYIDYDNEAPAGDVRVRLANDNVEGFDGDGKGFVMSIEGTSRDYRKGVIYRYATSTLPTSSTPYSYCFEITDASDPPTSIAINIAERSGADGATCLESLIESEQFPAIAKSGPTVASDQILDWVGTGTYEDGGIYPKNGGTNTVFIYKVKYFGNNAPNSGYPMVSITSMGTDGATIATATMKPETTDSNYTNGKVYLATCTLSGTECKYSFEIADNPPLVGNGPEIYPNGAGSAFIDWTGESGYEDDGVEPDIDSYGNTFTCRIKYVNVEGTAPDTGYPKISIPGVCDNYPMNLVPGTSATGDIYQYQGVYPLSEYGTITGTIQASSVLSIAVNFWAANIPPILTWADGRDDGVEPNIGTAGTRFTFRIKYMDPENGDSPSGIALMVDRAPFTMTQTTTKGIYEYNGTFSLAEHTYYFNTSDSMGAPAGGAERVVGEAITGGGDPSSGFATFTVSIGSLTSGTITGTDAIVMGESAIFTADAKNEFGGVIGDNDVDYLWEIIDGTGTIIGSASSKIVTIKAGTSTGTITLKITISKNPNSTLQGDDVAGTKTITIKPGKPQALFFSETGTNTILVSLPVGSSTGFAVSGRDGSGNTITVTECNWMVNGGIGSLNTPQGSQVFFTAGTTTGTGSVIVSTPGINGILTATASITIIPGGFHHFDISLGSLTVKVDGSITITLFPKDINDNPFTGDVVPLPQIQVAVGTVTVNLGTSAVGIVTEFPWPVGLQNKLGTGTVYAWINGSKIGTSNQFSVVSGSPHHFKITSPVANTAVQAGGSLTITAQLQDMCNNPLSLGTVSQVVFSSDSFGTFSFSATSTTTPGTITIQTNVNGQASGTYQPNPLAGSKAIFVGVFLASDNMVCGTSGVSILTIPAALATIIVTTPATFTAGIPGTISVVVRDSYNNPSTATITFAGNSLGTITPTWSEITGEVGNGFVWQGGGTWTGTVSFTKAQSQAILNVTAQNGKTATATFDVLSGKPATMSTAITPGTVAVVNSQMVLSVRLADQCGNPVAATDVNWQPQWLPATTTQTLDGTATIKVSLGTTTGVYVVTAGVGTLTTTFTITAVSGAPRLFQNFTHESRTVGNGIPLEIGYRDESGNPASGTVAWTLIQPLPAAASISATNTDINQQTGSASVTLTPGTRSGVYVVKATVGTLTATFTITATPDEPATISTSITPEITAMVGSQMILRVGLSDKYGNQVATTTVNWQSQGIAATTTQTMNGTASLGFTLGTKTGVYIVTAMVGTLTATITITALPGEPATMTAITYGTVTGVNTLVELRVGLSDQYGNPVATKTIDWQPVGSLTTQILAAITTQTIIGTASLTFTLGTKTGEYIVRASFGTLTATFTITAVAGIPRLFQNFTHESRTVGNGIPLEIGYRDESGNPGSGTVEWSLIEPLIAAASISATDTTINSQTGSATVTFTLGTKTGEYMVRARIGTLTATFTITALPGEPATITAITPGTTTMVGSQVKLMVGLSDQYGNSVATRTITWQPVGTLSSQILEATTTTQTISGTASLTFTLGTKTGEYVVRATCDGRIATFIITATHATPTISPVGNFQNFTTKTCLPGADIPLEIGYRDVFGNVVAGTVTWEIIQMPATASLSATNTTINPQTGSATATFTTGTMTGEYVIKATIGTLTAIFTITVQTGGGVSDELLIYPNPVKVQEWDRCKYLDGPWVRFGKFNGQVTVRIYDVSGSLIRIMENVTPNDNSFVQWDIKNDDGIEVNAGIYLCVTTANGKKMIGRFAVIR